MRRRKTWRRRVSMVQSLRLETLETLELEFDLETLELEALELAIKILNTRSFLRQLSLTNLSLRQLSLSNLRLSRPQNCRQAGAGEWSCVRKRPRWNSMCSSVNIVEAIFLQKFLRRQPDYSPGFHGVRSSSPHHTLPLIDNFLFWKVTKSLFLRN